jgi:predicted DNA-binding ribbon-helix-helix protein
MTPRACSIGVFRDGRHCGYRAILDWGTIVKRGRQFAESRVVKRSVRIGAHNTSFTVEEEFWRGLKEISLVKQLPLANLLADIDSNREHSDFSSAVRLFVLDYYVTLAKQKNAK